jgi:outer membrane immunogenic protein
MRVSLAVGCLLAATIGLAQAADMPPPYPPPAPPPVYAPAPPPPPFTWTGFYFGANGGYGFAPVTATATATSLFGFAATATSSATLSGPLGGGQIGFNWQFNSVVVGLEVDGDWSNQNHSTSFISCFGACTVTGTSTINWFATARGRIGYAFDRVLIYGTGGGALINGSGNLTASGFGVTANLGSISNTPFGFAAGGGVEAAITPNLSLRAEYLFLYSNNFSASTTIPLLGVTLNEKATISDSIVRAGVNWRFML